MNSDDLSQHLSRVQTHWSLLFRARECDKAAAAERELLLRYHGAVYRYLLGMVRDSAAAEELAQEFAVRFLRGDFRRADPQRGRFRDLIKTSVRHLAIDYWSRKQREQQHGPQPLPSDSLVGPTEPPGAAEDTEFMANWREELLARTWDALAQAEGETGVPYHSVLRCKTDNPEARSAELALELKARLGRSLNENAFRQTLLRARQRFADLLLAEVARSIDADDTDLLEQELVELGLIDQCRAALQRRQPS